MADSLNVSPDLIWEITRNNNAFLAKRRSGGGVQFSRDPLNLTNKHSRKYAGFVNDKAFGIQPGKKGSIVVTKKSKHHQNPAKQHQNTSHNSQKSGPKLYKSVVASTAGQGYRPDLRREAVARSSAIRKTGRPVKETPERKPRGAKARKAQ